MPIRLELSSWAEEALSAASVPRPRTIGVEPRTKMAEIAGLFLGAVGVLGVIGAFKDTIELFNLFTDARHASRELQILDTKLDIEKTLLLQWAEGVGLARKEYDKRLDDATTQELVVRSLAWSVF